MKSFSFKIAALLISTLTISCTKIVTRQPDSCKPPEKAEPEFCSTPKTYTSSYTISGTATFEKRNLTDDGLDGLVSPNPPIRGAEIKVVDSSGNTVQCGVTGADGSYSVEVPQGGASYTIKVISRSYSNDSKASVLNNPTSNTPYEISQAFVADNSKIINLTASASNNDLRAGAFNILDQIYTANTFLKNNTNGSFTVEHKVQAYWAKGTNPVTYFNGDPNNGVSFYVPCTDKLYILGGIEGDVTVEDTDHFDDHVIIHEYGHFIEDNYAISDSPGGAHYGTYVIDPRLAWSEAFATFLATQALNDPIYKDSIGIFSEGTGGIGFYYDVDQDENNLGNPMDTPSTLGEGNFRELAVLRFLYDAVKSTAFDFEEFWNVFTGTFLSSEPFREMSLFLQKQASAGGATDLSARYPNALYLMDATRAHYGTRDNTSTPNDSSNPLCQWTIQANAKLPSSAGSGIYDRSNHFHSNDFFYYYHPGGWLSVTLNYQTAGSNADLDLYIYKDGYSYGYADDLLTYSNKGRCPGTSCESGTESISINAPAGHYMINVMYALEYSNCSNPNDLINAGCDPTTYTLRIGGSDYICR